MRPTNRWDRFPLLAKLIRLVRKLWDAFDLYVVCLHHKDKFLRKRGAKIGINCDLIADVRNFGGEPYLIQIGDRVTVTHGVQFITHDGSTRLFRDKISGMNKFGNLFGPITIGTNCFIGMNAILLPDTHIGDNSIVAAGAVVKGRFPTESVIAGVPGRSIMSLDDYLHKTQQKMIPLTAVDRRQLRKELESYFFANE